MIHNIIDASSMPRRSNDLNYAKEEEDLEGGGNSSTESGGEGFSRTESGGDDSDSTGSQKDGARSPVAGGVDDRGTENHDQQPQQDELQDEKLKTSKFAPPPRSPLRAKGGSEAARSTPDGAEAKAGAGSPEMDSRVVPSEGLSNLKVPSTKTKKRSKHPGDPWLSVGPGSMERFKFIPWDPQRFQYVRQLQMAERNQGFVNLYQDLEEDDESTADLVAVKVMPRSWMQGSDAEFEQHHPNSLERPWRDVQYTALLSLGMQLDISCPFKGLYFSEEHVYFAMGYANQGDLFDCLSRLKGDGEKGVEMGPMHEMFVREIIGQLCKAVQTLHEKARFAHLDLSLENVVLHQAKPNAPLQVRLIDFGMARALPAPPDWAQELTGGEAGVPKKGIRIPGKTSYRAPELYHLTKAGDLELLDSFSLGVIFFALLTGEPPWISTRPGEDRCFDCFSKDGLRPFLRRLRTPRPKVANERVIDSLSEGAVDLLDGLLNIDPRKRSRLREPKDLQVPTLSVWSHSWWQDPLFPESIYGG